MIMKTFVYILLLACNVFFLSACNESTEIEVLAPTPTTGDEGGSNVEFTPEQLKLPYKKGACFTLRDNNYVQNMLRVATLRVGWNYSWGGDYVSNQLAYVEFVPMAWGSASDAFVTKIKGYVNKGKCKRVLGFNERGIALLKEKAVGAGIPVITRVSEINKLSEPAKKLFETECRATDLFSLALPKAAPCGLEYTAKIIKTE